MHTILFILSFLLRFLKLFVSLLWSLLRGSLSSNAYSEYPSWRHYSPKPTLPPSITDKGAA